MNIAQLIELLNKALVESGPETPVLLAYEENAMREGYKEDETEGVSDVRLVDDWPLPGKSLATYEGKKPQKVVIFYDNHYKLADSSAEE